MSDRKTIHADHVSLFNYRPLKNKEEGNYIVIGARVISGKQTDVTLNYGADENKSGSFSFVLKNDTLYHNYLVRVSSQYNWYNRNNSWLSVYPAGNDIEINNIEILKGD